jgi:hypothetical protein
VAIIVALIERLGWPGAVVILAYVFVERHATAHQKQELIDRVLLPEGLPEALCWTVPTLVGILLLFAQRYYWKRRAQVLQQENTRLAEWKSAVQQGSIATELHHTSEVKKEGGRKGKKSDH